MPNLPIQLLTIAADIVIIVFAFYYLLRFRSKEKEVEKKEKKIDSNYHQIVDNALTKERRILDDATEEADQIIHNAKFLKDSTQEAVDLALQKMVSEIQKSSIDTAGKFMESYTSSLKTLAGTSLDDFQNVAKALEGDLQKQMKEFKESVLPNMEKEIEDYKKIRLKESEETISKIVEAASQEFFNKSITVEDHEKLLIDSLEKAKAKGAFD